MLKIYRMPDGKTYQYEEGEQPAYAVEVKTKAAAPPETKAKKPANKARKAATK
jgi:hypothetical protein